MDLDIHDKIIGSFMGLAIGNALGSPLKGLKPGAIKCLFKEVSDYVDVSPYLNQGVRRYRLPGIYNILMQQALIVANSLISKQGLDKKLIIEYYKEFASVGPDRYFGIYRGYDKSFRMFVDRLIQNRSSAHNAENSLGCSLIIQNIPLAYYYYNNPPEQLTSKIIEHSLMSNNNPITISASLAFVYILISLFKIEPGQKISKDIIKDAVSYCRYGEEFLDRHYHSYLIKDYHTVLHVFSDNLQELFKKLDELSEEQLIPYILELANNHLSYPLNRITTDCVLTLGIYAVIWPVLNVHDPESQLIKAINSGGETDILGTMVGSLVGACFGYESIPKRWLEGLVNAGEIKCYAEAMSGDTKYKRRLSPLVEMEKKLTWKEYEQGKRYVEKALQKKAKSKQKKKTETPVETMLGFSMPDKKDKVSWKKYQKQKTKMLRQRKKNS